MLVVQGATDLRLLIVLMRSRILLLEAAEIAELRCSWLKRTANKQISWQKRGEIHVHGCSGGRHVACILRICLPVSASIDGHICSMWVSTSVASNRMLI